MLALDGVRAGADAARFYTCFNLFTLLLVGELREHLVNRVAKLVLYKRVLPR